MTFDQWWEQNEMFGWADTEKEVARLTWLGCIAAHCQHPGAYQPMAWPELWVCPDCDMRFSYKPQAIKSLQTALHDGNSYLKST